MKCKDCGKKMKEQGQKDNAGYVFKYQCDCYLDDCCKKARKGYVKLEDVLEILEKNKLGIGGANMQGSWCNYIGLKAIEEIEKLEEG